MSLAKRQRRRLCLLCLIPLLTFVIDVSRTTRYFRHLGSSHFLRLTHLSASLSSSDFLQSVRHEAFPPRLYKDCIDIHLYLMKILSNNNATVQDYQPSISSAPRRPGLRGHSVTCLYNILFVLRGHLPRLVMLFRITEYLIMQIPFDGRREIYILYICVEK